MKKYYNTELIDIYLDENCLSKASFCRQIKISPSTLYRIYKQEKSVRLEVVMLIAAYIKVGTNKLCNIKLKNED